MNTRWCYVGALVLCPIAQAQAGMTVYQLNDVVRLRLEDISFFAVLLLGCALGMKCLWNFVIRDFPRWPKLGYGRALGLTVLLSLLMLLVLSMISGARELLTPGAWRKQGHAYRLTDPASDPQRRQSLESLRSALHQYASTHQATFPPHDFIAEIPEKLWQSPDASGTRYLYVGGLTTNSPSNILAFEPLSFGDKRLVLFVSGEIAVLPTSEIRSRLGFGSKAW